MEPTFSVRFSSHPDDFKKYDTQRLRELFLIDDLFQKDKIHYTYSHYDRFIVAGAMPVTQPLHLLPFSELKANYFLERRELGIINVGGDGSVSADGVTYKLKNKEALYIGRGVKEVIFFPSTAGESFYYINSTPAHAVFPSRKVSLEEAEMTEVGSVQTSNHRLIRKLIVQSVLPTCQLQMGLTELKPGSTWNTMPPHTHTRRMEAYFYFDLPANQVVSHFMGPPEETRHLWVQNRQAVLSPPWSIHCGSGTSSYSFIWAMGGENLDYSDMDAVSPSNLK